MDYSIRENIYCCNCAGRIVLLDTQADRYFLVPEELGPALLRLWNREPTKEQDLRELGRLKSMGVVTVDRSPTLHDPSLSTIAPPTSELLAPERPRRRWSDVARAAGYQLEAWLRIRTKPIAELLIELSSTSCPSDNSKAVDVRLTLIASAFRATAGIFRQHDQCLPRSIAFRRMCTANGLDTTLVIGVALDPFSAHAWVQAGGRVLNDSLEKVRCYTPIFAI